MSITSEEYSYNTYDTSIHMIETVKMKELINK